jgi:hypothetical protein
MAKENSINKEEVAYLLSERVVCHQIWGKILCYRYILVLNINYSQNPFTQTEAII